VSRYAFYSESLLESVVLPCGVPRGLAWDRDGKGGPLTKLAFDLNLAVKQLRVFFNDVQTQAQAAMQPGIRTIHLAKFLKDDRHQLFGNAYTGVCYSKH
jgi:hypothetical protein